VVCRGRAPAITRSRVRWSSSSPPWRHEPSWPTSPTVGARTSR
jgi:hypothetical protein